VLDCSTITYICVQLKALIKAFFLAPQGASEQTGETSAGAVQKITAAWATVEDVRGRLCPAPALGAVVMESSTIAELALALS